MLFDKQRIRSLKVECRTVLDQLSGIHFVPLLSGWSCPDDNHAVALGKLRETAGKGNRIEHRHSLFDWKNIRSAYFTENGNLGTVDLLDDDADDDEAAGDGEFRGGLLGS